MTLYNSKKLSSIADLCTNLYALALGSGAVGALLLITLSIAQ
jgi:hypothetical protein